MTEPLVMNEQLLWDIVCQNAQHIKTINGELGGVLASLNWMKSLMMWQLGIGGAIFVGIFVNIMITSKNGRK